jgi:hypothetical protein
VRQDALRCDDYYSLRHSDELPTCSNVPKIILLLISCNIRDFIQIFAFFIVHSLRCVYHGGVIAVVIRTARFSFTPLGCNMELLPNVTKIHSVQLLIVFCSRNKTKRHII